MSTSQHDRAFLKEQIKQKVLKLKTEGAISYNPWGGVANWSLDFRHGFSHKDFLAAASRLFWELFDRHQPYQIGGLESAALPLITALVMSSERATGFYIRKSRKKKSFLKQIEGDLYDDREIILVDDLINSGSTFQKQIKVLESERGLKVKAIFAIVRFRSPEFYHQFEEQGIAIYSLFTLEELALVQGPKSTLLRTKSEHRLWHFKGQKPHFFQQGVKNQPILFRDSVLFTTDEGNIWRLKQETGEVLWRRKVLLRLNPERKTFPISRLHHDTLYVGTYQGTLLALKAESGLPLFRMSLAEHFTSRVAAYGDRLLFGCGEGRGAQAYTLKAFDTTTREATILANVKTPVRGSIVVDEKREQIVFATKNNKVYCIDLMGRLLWHRALGGNNSAGLILNNYGDILAVNDQGVAVFLHADSGETMRTFLLPDFHHEAPVCIGYRLYGATLAREVYCYDYRQHTMLWKAETDGRMYSAPTVWSDWLLVGDNNGCVYGFAKDTGEHRSLSIFAERITNQILLTPRYTLISTFADELYMMQNIPNVLQAEVHEQNHQATDRDSKHRDENRV